MQLPAVPADLKVCFARVAPPPAEGALTKKQLFDLIAKLKASADEKDACGDRLVAWYEDVSTGFANPSRVTGK